MTLFEKTLVIAAIGLSVHANYISFKAATKVAAMLSQVKKDVEMLQNQQKINAEDLKLKTHPAVIDKSLRAWFESQIKQSPQVRGNDGFLPKER